MLEGKGEGGDGSAGGGGRRRGGLLFVGRVCLGGVPERTGSVRVTHTWLGPVS